MSLQSWINQLSEGPVAKAFQLMAAMLGFAALAFFYDMHAVQGFDSPEGMETAQLARNLARGNGFSTQVLRPIDITLVQKQSSDNLNRGLYQPQTVLPDIHNAPLYPAMVAGVFKVLAFNFRSEKNIDSRYLESWMIGLNQVFFFIAVLLLYIVAKRLFDASVAGMSATLFAATHLFWQFTLTGLSTPLLIVIFLGIIWCLTRILLRNTPESPETPGGIRMGLLLGALIGLGCLTRYSFGFILIPVIFLLGMSLTRKRAGVLIAVIIATLVVVAPWLTRNVIVSGNLFGSASYSIFQQTVPFPGDTLERSLDIKPGLNHMQAQFYVDKLMINVKTILEEDITRLGGSWLTLFFVAGILVPFRNKTLSKLRFFLIGTLVLFILVESLGRTHVTTDMPQLNTENLLAVLAPLVFVFGVSLFYSLLEPLLGETNESRPLIVGLFGLVMSLPLVMFFFTPPTFPETNPNEPSYIQWASGWMRGNDLIASDVPAAVAWHGDRPCSYLPNNPGQKLTELSAIKDVKAILLTGKTLDIQSMKSNSWERFAMEAWARGEVPDNFPLTHAPNHFLPERLFLSDRDRWKTTEQ
jgi:hypothetical protein